MAVVDALLAAAGHLTATGLLPAPRFAVVKSGLLTSLGAGEAAAAYARNSLARDRDAVLATEADYHRSLHKGNFLCRYSPDSYVKSKVCPHKAAINELIASALEAELGRQGRPPALARALVLDAATGATSHALAAVGVPRAHILAPALSTATCAALRRQGLTTWAGDVATFLAQRPLGAAPFDAMYLDYMEPPVGCRLLDLEQAFSRHLLRPGAVLALTFTFRLGRPGWNRDVALQAALGTALAAAAAHGYRLQAARNSAAAAAVQEARLDAYPPLGLSRCLLVYESMFTALLQVDLEI